MAEAGGGHLASLVIAFLIGRRITGPLHRLRRAMQLLAVGKIDLTGANNIGVLLQSWTTVSVNVGDLAVNGDFGSGVVAIGLEGATVNVRTARFTGDGTGGVSSGSDGAASAWCISAVRWPSLPISASNCGSTGVRVRSSTYPQASSASGTSA